MKLPHKIVIMGIGSLVIQYLLMIPIMVNSRIDITNNIDNVYMSIIMPLFMIFLNATSSIIIISALLALFVYLYRNQIAIKDKQYLEGMIEHHSMALLTSEQILKKTDDYNVSKLAKNIIQTQEDEIKIMRDLLEK